MYIDEATGYHYYVNEFAQTNNGHLFLPQKWIICKGLLCADSYAVSQDGDVCTLHLYNLLFDYFHRYYKYKRIIWLMSSLLTLSTIFLLLSKTISYLRIAPIFFAKKCQIHSKSSCVGTHCTLSSLTSGMTMFQGIGQNLTTNTLIHTLQIAVSRANFFNKNFTCISLAHLNLQQLSNKMQL